MKSVLSVLAGLLLCAVLLLIMYGAMNVPASGKSAFQCSHRISC